MDAKAIIDSVVIQSGTDASRATLLSILNERYLAQVATARWLLAQTTIGPGGATVAGISTYTVPSTPEVVELLGLKVAGCPWDRIGEQEMWELQAATAIVSTGRGGVFAPSYDAAGALAVVLYPTPNRSGLAIQASCAVLPSALTDSPSSLPVTPTDGHGSLVDGVTSMVLSRIDERSDLAAPFEARYDEATEVMRRRKNSLMRGRGPVQIQVAGVHWGYR